MSVEQLWERYREQIENPNGPLPVPGPPGPRTWLWALTDARDTATGGIILPPCSAAVVID